MAKMQTRDLSKAQGKRIRIRFDEYHPDEKQFKPIRGMVILLNAADRPQVERLFKAAAENAEAFIRGEGGV